MAVVLAAVLIGCGRGGGNGSEEDQIRAVIEDFNSAVLDRDWAEACGYMTAESQRVLARVGRGRGADGGCTGTLRTGVGEQPEERTKRDFEDVEITDIKVNERQLTATVRINGQRNVLTTIRDQWLFG